ncbi:ribonuclease P protein subunit p40-like isoform X2 [Actinia tenebrosa]|uniref:Ribonuclease P protein subunit p40-like isoform X2 n=1 Tax=Actinia tenebrosa TaxID=6105 RepID=A0A6P8J1J5_ACTTE|nr:ribonuclease P protein subunit p40-like isoform X2 [Actinia tenebrosa]
MADVKQFKTPKRRLVFEKNSLEDTKQRHKKQITEHYFNHSVSLVIPGCAIGTVKHYFREHLPSLDEFCVAVLPLHVFIEKEFIEKFIRQGNFYALSRKTKLDTENCVAVLPTVVEIDLKSPSFHPGKNLYERVRWCLKEHLDLEFEFVFTWTDTDNKLDIKDIQSHFRLYKCCPFKNKEDIRSLSNARIPVVNSQETQLTDKDNDNISCAGASGFYEWLGSIHCDIECSSGSPDSYVSTFTCPNPSTVSKEMVKCQWTGFITPQRILNLLEASRSFLQCSPEKPPWIALNVWGFADTPVSWLKNEHGFHYEGDNMYTMIIFPSDIYWCYMALGSNDVCS